MWLTLKKFLNRWMASGVKAIGVGKKKQNKKAFDPISILRLSQESIK